MCHACRPNARWFTSLSANWPKRCPAKPPCELPEALQYQTSLASQLRRRVSRPREDSPALAYRSLLHTFPQLCCFCGSTPKNFDELIGRGRFMIGGCFAKCVVVTVGVDAYRMGKNEVDENSEQALELGLWRTCVISTVKYLHMCACWLVEDCALPGTCSASLRRSSVGRRRLNGECHVVWFS